jgi:putative ABC transport system permease protein
MIAPLLIPRLTALVVLPVAGARGAGPLLVRQHARAGVRRTAATAAPVFVAVSLAGSLSAMINSIDASDRASTRARVAPDALVVTADGDLSAGDVEAVRRAAGGAPVGATLEGDLLVSGAGGPLAYRTIGADPEALGLMLRTRVLAGSLAYWRGDAVALGELTARTLRKGVGDRVGVWLPDGTRRTHTLKVVAVLADGFSSTSMYVPRAVLAGHVGDRAATAVYVRAPAGALDAVARARGLSVGGGTASRKVADVTDSSNMNPLALLVILAVAIVYVAIALAGTAAIGTVARSRDLALLRLAGASRREVVRLVAAEALVTTAVGGALGCALTAMVVAGLRHGLAGLEGPTAVALPWTLVGGLLAAFAAIAVTASALAAERSQRPAPQLLVGGAP